MFNNLNFMFTKFKQITLYTFLVFISIVTILSAQQNGKRRECPKFGGSKIIRKLSKILNGFFISLSY